MLLLTGPSASGKTTFCVQRIQEHLRAGDRNWRLLVPTATMAEHIRNQLARQGFVFSPTAISTLAKFVDNLVPDLPNLPTGALEIITGEALAGDCPARYLPMRDFIGFRRALASAIEEFVSAGATLSDLPRDAADFGAVASTVLAAIHSRGMNLNGVRLREAQARLAPADTAYYLVGFYSFNNPELEFVRALAGTAKVTISITEWAGSESAIAYLRTFAVEKRSFEGTSAPAQRTLVAAPTLDAELTDMARRIHEEHERGRPWRDMGIVVRSEQPYVPALRSALERFGIPTRFYFGSPLARHSLIRYFTALVDAMLRGWDHAATIDALRLAGSPLEHADKLEYDVRSRLPGAGLADIAQIADPAYATFFAQLEEMTPWALTTAPAATWAERFATLRRLCSPAKVDDGISHEDAMMLRARANAIESWEEALTNTAAIFGVAPISCSQFRSALATVLDAMSLRVPDHRRDVVHIIDAFEARQWRLPVLFVCGLIEKQFPKYHSENPILDDRIRRHLQSRGIPLRTSTERQSDEQFLFDCILGRASEHIVLSYPVLNAKADANLPSFLIERAKPFTDEGSVDARPAPLGPRGSEPYPGIFDEQLRSRFAEKHSVIAASAIEAYLQCPYQFYIQRSLRLEDSVADPWERLDPIVQGDIAHAVLERVYRHGRPIEDAFNEIFARTCAEKHVPDGYRTEAIRLDLLHNLQLLVRDDRLKPGTRSLYEEKFNLPLGDGTVVRGRIDRIEIDSAGRAIVFDYKYSGKNSVQRTEAGHDEKTRVQGGLYMLALPQLGDYTPAGMVYCGFKRELSFGGWIVRPFYTDIKKDCEHDRLHDIMQLAREAALETAQKIRGGEIRPAPADEGRCEFCACAKMCRVEMVPATAVAGGSVF